MAKTAHQSVGEFYLRPPIAGLKVLTGVAAVQASFEDPTPANGRTVLAALLALTNGESVYNNIHKAEYFQIRALNKVLQPISSVAGGEEGDSASIVAGAVRNALLLNAAIAAFFTVSGTGVSVILTAITRAANDATMELALTNGSATGMTPTTSANTTAGVAPVAQVETATAAGSVTGSGNATVIVTAAGMTGSPKTFNVPVLNGDTAAQWADKVRIALAADSAVTALFTVGGTSTSIVLTRTNPAGVANDATLNISLANGTSTGITTAATSANTTAGVAGTQQVETLTVTGAPTTDGNILITVTAVGLTGTPVVVQVPVNGSQYTDILITDAVYAAAKATGGSNAGDALRDALVILAQDYIPGFTGVGLLNAGRF